MSTVPKKKKVTETCRGCGGAYGEFRPQCKGEECVSQRQINHTDGSVEKLSGFCVFCCFGTFRKATPPRKRIALPNGTFLCYQCGRTVAVICICCPDSILCGACCENYYNHKICCKTKNIEFTNQGLSFAYPANRGIVENGIGWAKRDEALQILQKTYPITYLDPKGFTRNESRRFASVEIEIFDYNNATNLNKVLESWNCSVVRDASMLREAQRRGMLVAKDKTFEINTSPACGNALYYELEEITTALNQAEAKVTIDCGIHVHVDCRDYGYQDIRKLIKVYYFVEEALFSAVHWTRRTNDFCKPCGEDYYQKVIANHVKPTTNDLKQAIITSVYGDKSLEVVSFDRHRRSQPNFWHERADHYGRNGGLHRNEKRYSAINLHSYFLRGTVEDRIHHGSTDFKEIYGWAKILVDLFDSIASIPDNRLDKMLELSPYEINSATELIRGNEITRKPLDVQKVSIGVALLQYLLPQDTFQMFLDKVMVNCHDEVVSKKKVLYCQKGKVEEQPEVFIEQQAAPVNPFLADENLRLIDALRRERREVRNRQRGR